MQRVMLVPNNLYEESLEDARRLESWLDDRLVDVMWAPKFGFDEGFSLEDIDLVISLGGDGTLLRAARLVGYSETPILGLSYGHLGFLTCDSGGVDITTLVGQALAGDLHVSRRTTLKAQVSGVAEDGSEVTREAFALNEVLLSRGGSGKIVEFSVDVNGRQITELRGDGLVVASATGSTGYALSAGGPIVNPDFKGMVCVPLAPHTITARAFLTAASDVIEVRVTDGRSLDRCVFADGNSLAEGFMPLSLKVVRGPGDIVLLTNGDNDFYRSVSRVFYSSVH